VLRYLVERFNRDMNTRARSATRTTTSIQTLGPRHYRI